MKKIISGFIFSLAVVAGHCCTSFFFNHNGQFIFGRNYDWMADAGMVCTNQKGLRKSSVKTNDGDTINWVSQYGNITFNQYGKEFPTGGMNEKGLVVELMWLDGTVYPSPDKRPSIGVLQWIQYQLDNCATIDDVIATDKKLRINSKGTPLHYLIADANGNAASIEFLAGKMVVHTGNDLALPVLTNDTYEKSIASRQNGNSSGSNSLTRFDRACSMLQQYQTSKPGKPMVDYSFDILSKVSQGDFTKWSIVYDISNKKIYFKTEGFQQIKTIGFSSVDFSCDAGSLAMDMNISGEGDIRNKMTAYTPQLNQKIVEKAYFQSQARIQASIKEKEAILAYSGRISCN